MSAPREVTDTIVGREVLVSEVETWAMVLGVPYRILIRILRGELTLTNVYRDILSPVLPEDVLKDLTEYKGHEPIIVAGSGDREIVPAGDINIDDKIEIIDVGFARVTDLEETAARMTVFSGNAVVYHGPKHTELSILPARRGS